MFIGRCECSPAGVPISISRGALTVSLLITSQTSSASIVCVGESGATGNCSGGSAQQHAEVRSRFGRAQHDDEDSQHDSGLDASCWQHDVDCFSAFFEQHPPHVPTPASSDCVSSDAAVNARISV